MHFRVRRHVLKYGIVLPAVDLGHFGSRGLFQKYSIKFNLVRYVAEACSYLN